jgi:hypothetical protein
VVRQEAEMADKQCYVRVDRKDTYETFHASWFTVRDDGGLFVGLNRDTIAAYAPGAWEKAMHIYASPETIGR